jgi:hypothetical protein
MHLEGLAWSDGLDFIQLSTHEAQLNSCSQSAQPIQLCCKKEDLARDPGFCLWHCLLVPL